VDAPLELVVSRPATIKIRVTTTDNLPFSGVVCWTVPHDRRRDDDYRLSITESDEPHIYVVSGLVAGRYDLGGFASSDVHGENAVGAIARDIDVGAGEVRVIELKLAVRPLIRVKVVDRDGSPGRYQLRVAPTAYADRAVKFAFPLPDGETNSMGTADVRAIGSGPLSIIVCDWSDETRTRELKRVDNIVINPAADPAATVEIALAP
jgi:hypothetical protein